MAEVKISSGDSIDRALKRFKQQVRREGILQEMKKREYYEKPSEKRKKREAAAKRRTRQSQRQEAE